jgi:hypothetical protein
MPPLKKKVSKRKSSSAVVINKARMEDDRRRVPSQVEEQFGQIGFVKWTNTYCPVLCVDPFDTATTKTTVCFVCFYCFFHFHDLDCLLAGGHDVWT